jgi:alpha-L-fucosidase
MLLNIGPRPDGRIAPADEDVLRDLGLWMMLYGESVRGVRPWTVTNEGGVWFTTKRAEGTVYALAVLENNAKTLLLKSVTATPGTKVTLLSQEGELPWEQTPVGLKITVTRKQTIRLVKAKPDPDKAETSDIQRLTWGLEAPVAVKITQVQSPAAPAK